MVSWGEPGIVTEPESRGVWGLPPVTIRWAPQKQPPGVDLSCGASHRTCEFRPDLQPGHCLRPSVPIPGTWELCTVSVGRSPCLQRPQSPHLGLLNQNFQPTWCLCWDEARRLHCCPLLATGEPAETGQQGALLVKCGSLHPSLIPYALIRSRQARGQAGKTQQLPQRHQPPLSDLIGIFCFCNKVPVSLV